MPIAISVSSTDWTRSLRSVGLQHAGVVDAHAERARERRLLVGVDDAHLEQRDCAAP